MSWGIGVCVVCFNAYEKAAKNQLTCSTNCRLICVAKRNNEESEKKRLKRLARRRKFGI